MVTLPHASVIVCTHNRSSQLREACASILALDYPADRFELLIVNNASTDDTRAVADEIARTRPDLVRVIDEPVVGLSTARNTGVRHARGDVIAFGDDDAFPDRAWLRALAEALQQENVLAAGGPVAPIFQGKLPEWFSDRFLPYLAVWDRGPETQRLTYNDYPRGNNIAFRREVFERFGWFTPHLGRKGASLLSCEETEFCLRIERGGGTILYVPAARVRHLTVADRVTPGWLGNRFYAQGQSEAIVEWRHGGWGGLRRGWMHWARNLSHALRERNPREGKLFARCQRRALAGYSRALLSVPRTIPRWEPPAGAADWRPWT